MASETIAGSGAWGFAEGAGAAAQFDDPCGLAIDQDNNIIVADSSNHRIRRITSAGVVSTIAGSGAPGFAEGAGAAAQFNDPCGLATAKAFGALLHFLYSDALEVEDEFLVDVLRLADRCQVRRLYRLCLARMKAELGPEHACRWLAEVTKHSVVELQEPLLQYVTASWGKICEANPESVEQLEAFPKLMSAVLLKLGQESFNPCKRRRIG